MDNKRAIALIFVFLSFVTGFLVLKLFPGVFRFPSMSTSSTSRAQKTRPYVSFFVSGAVKHQGHYRVKKGTTLGEAIALAHPDPYANLTYYDPSYKIKGGEKFHIPKILQEDSPIKINLNTATKEELVTLPGIGPDRAGRILAYREKYGRFDEVEELLEISGIGEHIFRKIKKKVTVE